MWTPDDYRKLVEHARRFAGLPLIRHEPMLPAHDGDMAEIGALIDCIFAEAERTNTAPGPLHPNLVETEAAWHAADFERCTPGELLGTNPELWPDPIGDILASWPARIVAPVVIP
ncbi:hypothetical protein [Mycobacterium shimoidei]|uniref:hypothetical protein n=1 Tax=Mycobacterium shimoidei TaxID=29313 RepID=UPI001158AB44|nr:hypothetical protein [Mycobacterium shimoidei]